jgi:DNA-binding CsgD family transcriptional regulator
VSPTGSTLAAIGTNGGASGGARLAALSPREQQIVRLVAKGHGNKTIGSVLDISPWTVSTHLRRIFAKLGVGSRASMVASLYAADQSPLDAER